MPKLAITVQGHTIEVEITHGPLGEQRYEALVEGKIVEVIVPETDHPTIHPEWMIVDNRPYELVADPRLHWLRIYDGIYQVTIRDLDARYQRLPEGGDGRVKAPIPGLIARILVAPGQQVTAGDAVVVLEAMKMENEITATVSGTVTAVHVQPGQTVLRGQVLVETK
jgi:acetyl/propionyl-CoA carboxylase alpha subunit